MKTKINYPTKRYVRFGKNYLEYLMLEVEKGNITAVEFKYWKRQNEELKTEQLPFQIHARNIHKRFIPYNS